jgi:hypothetical protein
MLLLPTRVTVVMKSRMKPETMRQDRQPVFSMTPWLCET